MAAFPTSRGTCIIADRQQPCPPRRHCHWTAALVLAFLATTAVPATAQAQQTAPVSAVTAAADCPCLTPQEVSQRAAGHIRHPDPAKAPNVTCLDAGIDRPCLPPDFGSGSCGEWNFYIDPACQSDDHRPMCDMQWCFVDEATCQRQFYSATYLNISLPLYFSYSTCGYIYLNIDPAISQATQNWPSELRVSYPTVDDYRLFVAPARSMYSGTKFGVYPDLLDRSLLFLNYTGTIQERELTQQALDFSEQYFTYSSWSACVYMLAVNETDICAGPRNGDERSLMASFVHPVEFEEFYLVVPIQPVSSTTILQSFYNPFRPFTTGAWLAWFAVLCWVVLVFQWLEVDPRWAATTAHSQQCAHGDDDGHVASSTKHTSGWPRAFTNWLAQVVFRLQLSAEALDILGERLFLPMTVGGKIVSVTLSLFLMTMVASYTANLAAVLSTHTLVGDLSSLEEVIGAELTICVPSHVSVALRSTFPGMIVVEALENYLLPNVLNGTCACAVMSRAVAEDFQMENGCQVRIVGPMLYTLPVSFMTRKELLAGLNIAMEFALSHGIPSEISKHWKGYFYATKALKESDPSVCQDAMANHDSVAAGLSIIDMAGVFGLVFFSTLAALATEVAFRLWRQLKSPEAMASPADGVRFHVQNTETNVIELEQEDAFHAQLLPGCVSCMLSMDSLKHDIGCVTMAKIEGNKVAQLVAGSSSPAVSSKDSTDASEEAQELQKLSHASTVSEYQSTSSSAIQ